MFRFRAPPRFGSYADRRTEIAKSELERTMEPAQGRGHHGWPLGCSRIQSEGWRWHHTCGARGRGILSAALL